MKKLTLSLLILLPLSVISIDAKSGQSCQEISAGMYSCNPYGFNFIRVKEVDYKGKKKLVVDKTQPPPSKEHNKTSIPDIIEKYVKINEPVRYQPYTPAENNQSKNNQTDITEEDLKYYISIASSLKQQREALILKIIKEEEARFYQHQLILKEQQYQQARQKLKKDNNTTKVKKQIKYGYYKVKSGDTLSHIAYMFGISSKDIAKLNHISKKKHIRVNQKLKLPYTQEKIDTIAKSAYKVKSGDNLYTIAKEYNLKVSDIRKFNKYKKNKLLKIGEVVKLPLPYKVAQLKREAKAREEARKRRLALEEMRRYKNFGKHHLRVTATAYTSHRGQTDKTPFLAAWNNRLRPGMKIIAVSRDLLYKYGMKNGTKVKISGLKGYYRVRDKMNKRYKKRIDIYMGTNRRKALRWGRRSVVIHWE